MTAVGTVRVVSRSLQCLVHSWHGLSVSGQAEAAMDRTRLCLSGVGRFRTTRFTRALRRYRTTQSTQWSWTHQLGASERLGPQGLPWALPCDSVGTGARGHFLCSLHRPMLRVTRHRFLPRLAVTTQERRCFPLSRTPPPESGATTHS